VPATTADVRSHHRAHTRPRSERRRPEESVLYRVVQAHWPEFQERAEEAGGLPQFVKKEVDDYLTCGILEHGFLRLACLACGHERLVGFSCKRRGFCPSCLGRRMTDTAVHLAENVFPSQMVRQWVCSLPWKLRSLLGYDKALCAQVLRAFTEEVRRSLRHRAKKMLGLVSRAEAHTGGISFIQRFDSALRLNVHFHSLFLDGVFVRAEDGDLEFHELPEPSPEQVADVAARTSKRVIRLLEKAGKTLDSESFDDAPDDFSERQPALAFVYAAAAQGVDLSGDRAGQPSLRLIQKDDIKKAEPHAVVGGINIHAGVAFDARDKPRMERMCRYLARPPIAQDRLSLRGDGAVQYTMKKTWRDGTHAIVLQPLDLIARICAMIPPPRFNMIRFHGVLAPNAKLRPEVVPQKEARKLAEESAAELAQADQVDLFDRVPPKPKRHPWAWLIKRVFLVDVTECPDCGRKMKWMEACTEKRDIHRVLAAHGLTPRAPPPGAMAPLGQLRFTF